MANGTVPQPPGPAPQAPVPGPHGAGQPAGAGGKPPAQGVSPVVWILIGAGVLVFFGIVAAVGIGFYAYKRIKQTAGVAYRESRGPSGKVTYQTPDGDTVTIEPDAPDSGTVEFTGKGGKMQFGPGAKMDLPAWLPSYPGAKVTPGGVMQMEDRDVGTYTFTTGDTPQQVTTFFQNGLKDAGLAVDTITTDQGQTSAILSAKDDGDMRHASVVIGTEKGRTTVGVNFQVKKKP